MRMSVLRLPDEVWTRIVSLRCLQDRKIPSDEAHLWLELRRVNRTFANAIEKYNIDRYLRRTVMSFDFGIGYIQNPGNPDEEDDMIKTSINTVFRFDGFDENNPRMAILADRDCEPYFRKYILEHLYNTGGFQFEEETFRIQHIISLRRHVHELPLIHMEAKLSSASDLMVKFDWRATFSVWWAEVKALGDVTHRNSDSNVAFAEGLEAESLSAADPFDAMKKTMLRLLAKRDAAFRHIRRKRITRLLARLDDIQLSERSEDSQEFLSSLDEEETMMAMKKLTSSMNFAEFSDDSEGSDEHVGGYDMGNGELEGSEDDEDDGADSEAGYQGISSDSE